MLLSSSVEGMGLAIAALTSYSIMLPFNKLGYLEKQALQVVIAITRRFLKTSRYVQYALPLARHRQTFTRLS